MSRCNASPSPSWGGWLARSARRVGALAPIKRRARIIKPSPPGRSATTLPIKGRESVFALPSRAELKRAALLSLITTALCLVWPLGALAQEAAQSGSAINIDLGTGSGLTQRVVQLVGLMTVLSLAPSIVIMTTSFVRIIVVLSLLRTALGMQQSPPNAVLVSLALFLSAIVMAPTWQDSYDSGIRPLLDQQMELPQAFDAASEPVKTFMLAQVDRGDLALFTRLSKIEPPTDVQELPLRVVTPAFMISELKKAFTIGFLLFVPFLVIDLVVASVLMSMGMMMLPPVVISLPFKLIFFVLVDGWRLVAGSLVESFQRGAGGG
jgi:flagellar biosynthetic protein FliP